MESKIQEQLNILFLNLFDKQSLRRNAYFFKYLTEDLTLSIKAVYEQKKVAAITNNKELIKKVLSKCPLIQNISQKTIKLRMEGDFKLVKLFNMKDKVLGRKKLQEHSQKMKRQIIQQDDGIKVDFQSHAAAISFIQNLKQDPLVDFQFKLEERNPYYSIKNSVTNYKKQRNNHFYNNSNQLHQYKEKDQNDKFNYQMHNFAIYNNLYQNNNYINEKKYPVFIRKAIDTDQEQQKQGQYNIKKQKTFENKYKQKIQDNSSQQNKLCELKVQDFPSIIENSQIKKQSIENKSNEQEQNINYQKKEESQITQKQQNEFQI